MKLRNAFISSVAAAALTVSLSQDAAAQTPDNITRAQAQQQTVTPEKPAPRITTSRTVTLDPQLPVEVIAGLGGVYLLFCLLAARQRWRGSWLRASAGGALALTLLNPELLQEDREQLNTIVSVVVDKSSSQNLNGRAQATQAANEALITQLSGIEGIEVRITDVTSNAAGGAAPDGSNLFSALDMAISDVPRERLGAVIMLTDGQVHDVPQEHNTVKAGVPLHALISGQEGERDRRIVIESAPGYGLVNKSQKVSFRVIDQGVNGPAAKVRVSLQSDGKEIGSKTVTAGEVAEMSVNIAHAGATIVELKAEALEGELTDVNNRVVTSIEGIRETLNVLLVSGQPSAGVRMWRDLIKSDPNTSLVHFTTLRTSDKLNNVPLNEEALLPFPAHELFSEKIDKFDLIVFDHFENGQDGLQNSYFANIAGHVKDGGALLVLSGPEYAGAGSLFATPLSGILPAEPAGTVNETLFHPKVTDQGLRHPVTRDIAGANPSAPSWGRWTRMVDSKNDLWGHVVMEGAGREPLLILHRAEKGRVAMLQSDAAWLWARGFEGGGPYAELLRGVSHWLMQNPSMEEETLRLKTEDGKVVIEQQTMGERGTPVTLRSPSGETQTITPEASAPGVFRAEIPAGELGLYSAEQKGRNARTAFASVGPANPKEFVHTLSTEENLRPLVEQGKGRSGRMTNVDGALVLPRIVPQTPEQAAKGASGPDWMGVRMSNQSIVRNVTEKPLFPPMLALVMIIGMLGAAWHRQSERSFAFWRKKETPRPDGPAI